jgi:hypothetical protein
MSDCASAYTELRDKVVESAEEHLSQERLKCFISTFQPVINSKRRSSYINNFNDLITVLEKRGYVGEANVEPFGKIVNLLPDAPIFQEIYNYQCYMASNRLGGPYVSHGKIISTHYGVHSKRISKQLSKHIRFQAFPAVYMMIVTWVFIPCIVLEHFTFHKASELD